MHRFSQWQTSGKDGGSLLADPQFASTSVFGLKPSSPAITQLGFVPIDISTVGPLPRHNGDERVGAESHTLTPTGVVGDEHFDELAHAGLVR